MISAVANVPLSDKRHDKGTVRGKFNTFRPDTVFVSIKLVIYTGGRIALLETSNVPDIRAREKCAGQHARHECHFKLRLSDAPLRERRKGRMVERTAEKQRRDCRDIFRRKPSRDLPARVR